MSYLVLARKYRPKKLADVIGQAHVTRTLANAFATDRVHHAFLFCGPRGVGKTTLARILGKALNCEKGPTATPCDACAACLSIADGTAVDYQEMDGASNRGIDAIRDLTDSVRYQPAFVRKKVYVIDEVHMLTTEAFNALLKTLEEPPPHVTFVLATTEINKLPVTITSRCQRYDMKLVPSSQLTAHLQYVFAQEKIAVEAGALATIVREAGGSVRDALSLSDQVISFVGKNKITEADAAQVLGVADRAMTRGLVSSLVAGDAAATLALVDQALERGVDEVQITRALVRMLRDIRVAGLAPDQPALIDAPPDEAADIAALARDVNAARLHGMFERLLACADALTSTTRPRWVLEFALIDAATAEALVPLGDLLARLAELEGRVAKAPASGGGQGGGNRAAASASVPTAAPRATMQAPRRVPSSPARTQADAAASTASPANNAPVTASPDLAPAAESHAAPNAKANDTAPPAVSSAPRPPAATPGQTAPLAWEDVLRLLEERRKFSLLGYYQHARILSESDDNITVGFAPDFHSLGELAAEKSTLDEMRALLTECTGRARAVAVRLLSAAEAGAHTARSSVERERDDRTAETQRRERELREHPMTKKVLETFGAQIREIKTHA